MQIKERKSRMSLKSTPSKGSTKSQKQLQEWIDRMAKPKPIPPPAPLPVYFFF